MELSLNKEFVDAIAEKFGMFIDWSAENVIPQVMDILMRYRTYEITRLSLAISLVSIIVFICIGFLIAAWLEPRKVKKLTLNDNYSYYDGTFFEHYLHFSYDEEHKNYKVISSKIYEVRTFGYICFITVGVVLIVFGGFLSDLIFDLAEWLIIPEIQFYNLIKGV